jgi:hypothetical protein
MMPEHRPGDDPGHLDIDTVSAFIDRDLDPADLAMIEIHLTQCPACHREVLEIRTTIFLLAGLPQYEPRRSFRLGHEHVRAARRRDHARGEQAWLPPALTAGGQPVAALPAGAVHGGGMLAGMQVAAMIVGALLLLVTVGDLSGMMPNGTSPMQLAAPTAAAELPQAAVPAPPTAQPEVATDQSAVDGAEPPAPAAFETTFEQAPSATGGTESDESASQEMLAANSPAQPMPRMVATSAAAAAVTQAIPTPAAKAPAGEPVSTRAATAASESAEQPSRMRLVQIALALLLAWLVVTIAGLRWVRRLH